MESFQGSSLLFPIANRFNQRLDQVNYIAANALLLFIIAPLYRKYIVNSKTVSTSSKHKISTFIGITTLLFVFGINNALHLACLTSICIICVKLIPVFPTNIIPSFYLIGALSYLHVARVLLASNSTNATASMHVAIPMCIMVEKLTALCFSVLDFEIYKNGKKGDFRRNPELPENYLRNQHIVKKVPTVLEIVSFSFMFCGVMTGPPFYFNDFIKYIENTTRNTSSTQNSSKSNFPGLPKALFAYSVLVLGKILQSKFPWSSFSDEIWLHDQSFLYLTVYSTCAAFAARCVYVYAWKFGEGLCNAAGFGNDENSKKDENSNLTKNSEKTKNSPVCNINWLDYELAPNARQAINSWNLQTIVWLRLVAFERVPKTYRNIAAFSLSIVWHGVLPGYWLAFGIFHLALNASKSLNQLFGNGSRKSRVLEGLWQCFCVISVQVCFNYAGVLFNLRHWHACLNFLKRTYFAVPIICLTIPFVTNFVKKTDIPKKSE